MNAKKALEDIQYFLLFGIASVVLQFDITLITEFFSTKRRSMTVKKFA